MKNRYILFKMYQTFIVENLKTAVSLHISCQDIYWHIFSPSTIHNLPTQLKRLVCIGELGYANTILNFII